MQWDAGPPPLVDTEFFSAFPGHRRNQSHGSPFDGQGAWSPIPDRPPAWLQAPPASAPPAWATATQNFQPQSPTLAWNSFSPFHEPPMDVNPMDPWGSRWASAIPTRPTESTFGQPMRAGFFGAANASPRPNNKWNTIVRSTSERVRTPYAGAGLSPRWSPAQLAWDIDRPKSAGPGRLSPLSPPGRIGLPLHIIPDTWDETNLARRPRDWRASYNPRASFLSSLSVLPSALKTQSDVQEFADTTKRRFSPALEFHPAHPPVVHDLRLDPFDATYPIIHAKVSTNDHWKPFTDLDTAQFATTPNANFLRLFHPKLPWYIDITPSHPNGITVGDVLSQIYLALGQQILPRHYWNDVLNERDRKDIAKAYRRRTDMKKSGKEHGILWVDFLCGEVVFEGLMRGKGGLWEIKTRNAY